MARPERKPRSSGFKDRALPAAPRYQETKVGRRLVGRIGEQTGVRQAVFRVERKIQAKVGARKTVREGEGTTVLLTFEVRLSSTAEHDLRSTLPRAEFPPNHCVVRPKIGVQD